MVEEKKKEQKAGVQDLPIFALAQATATAIIENTVTNTDQQTNSVYGAGTVQVGATAAASVSGPGIFLSAMATNSLTVIATATENNNPCLCCPPVYSQP